MKIAILLSGRTDRWESAVRRNYDEIINPLRREGCQVDVFASFWDTPTTHDCISAYSPDLKIKDIESLSTYTEGLFKNTQEYFKRTQQYHPEDGEGFKFFIYGLYKLNRLYNMVKYYEKTNNTEYDYYIRLRPDATLSHPLKVEHLSKMSDSNMMVFVDHYVYIDGCRWGWAEGWVDDNFCVAKKRPFEIYCGIYESLVELCDEYKTCISHIILQKELEKHNITPLIPRALLVIVKPDRILNYFGHVFPNSDVTKSYDQFKYV